MYTGIGATAACFGALAAIFHMTMLFAFCGAGVTYIGAYFANFFGVHAA